MKIRGKITKDIGKVEFETRGKERLAIINWRTGKEKKSVISESYFNHVLNLGNSIEVVK